MKITSTIWIVRGVSFMRGGVMRPFTALRWGYSRMQAKSIGKLSLLTPDWKYVLT